MRDAINCYYVCYDKYSNAVCNEKSLRFSFCADNFPYCKWKKGVNNNLILMVLEKSDTEKVFDILNKE